MKNQLLNWINRPFLKSKTDDFKPLLSKLANMETPKMSDTNTFAATCRRAIDVIKKLRARVAELDLIIANKSADCMAHESEIVALKQTVADRDSLIATLQGELNEVVPEDVGGSTGGITG